MTDYTKQSSESVKDLETQFNRSLAAYNSAYKGMMEDLIQRNQANKETGKFFGKNGSEGSGNYVYVNDYGFTHKYSTDSWNGRDATCDSSPVQIPPSMIDKFTVGAPMGTGQPCGVAGRNVVNMETGEAAWVDIKGVKHPYSDEAWAAKSEGCDTSPIRLANAQFKALPEGPAMTTTDRCAALDVDPKAWANLDKMGEDLTVLGQKLAGKLGESVATDQALQQEIASRRASMLKSVDSTEEALKGTSSVVTTQATVTGELDNTRKMMVSSQYHYLAWLLLTLLILGLALHAVLSGTVPGAIGLIVAMALLFIIVRALSRHVSINIR